MDSPRRLGFASIDRTQEEALAKIVRGRRVVDLGAGSEATLAKWMADQGAQHVTAVDIDLPFGIQGRPSPLRNLSLIQGRFIDVSDSLRLLSLRGVGPFDVGVLSWPLNQSMPGLLELLDLCRKVVVISCNVDSTVCGGWDLWRYLARRSSTMQLIHRRNVMLVYEGPCGERPLLVEERLGIDNATGGPIVSFDDAYPSLPREIVCDVLVR